MKKTIAMLTSALLIASMLGACSSPAKKDTYTVGLAQFVEHPSLNTIRESFEDELKVLGYADKITVDYKNGQADQSNLNAIAQTFVGDKKDLIVAIATPTALSMAAATTEIPILFSAVTDPVGARLVSDPQKPDGNVTGTSDAIPVESIFGLAKELSPDAKTFGFLYNLGEPNSVSVIEQAKAYCDANGLAYVEATVANPSEVQQAAQSLIGRVDAMFTPIDNTVASAMPQAAQVAIEAKIPFYTGADSMVADGGFATVGIDYTFLGRKTAQMAVEILEGKKVADVPVATMDDFRTVINKDTAVALGLDVSGVAGADLVDTNKAG